MTEQLLPAVSLGGLAECTSTPTQHGVDRLRRRLHAPLYRLVKQGQRLLHFTTFQEPAYEVRYRATGGDGQLRTVTSFSKHAAKQGYSVAHTTQANAPGHNEVARANVHRVTTQKCVRQHAQSTVGEPSVEEKPHHVTRSVQRHSQAFGAHPHVQS